MSLPTFTIAPSATDSSDGNGGGAPRGASYFFGFLITFIGLLLIFVAFGIGSRRRYAARREAMLNGDPLRFLNGKPEADGIPPHLYERLFISSEEDWWRSLMPLSVQFWREENESESNSTAHDLPALPPVTPEHRSHSIFPSRIRVHHENQTDSDPEPPTAIQVAVMIVMPSNNLSLGVFNQPERLPEYQIGSINLPWPQHNLHPIS